MADSVLGAEDTAVNYREKSLALMELLTGWKQVNKQTNKQKPHKENAKWHLVLGGKAELRWMGRAG